MPNTEVRSTFIRIIVLTNVRLVRKGKRLEDPWDDFFAVHDCLLYVQEPAWNGCLALGMFASWRLGFILSSNIFVL